MEWPLTLGRGRQIHGSIITTRLPTLARRASPASIVVNVSTKDTPSARIRLPSGVATPLLSEYMH
jgi:hypothetical protein